MANFVSNHNVQKIYREESEIIAFGITNLGQPDMTELIEVKQDAGFTALCTSCRLQH